MDSIQSSVKLGDGDALRLGVEVSEVSGVSVEHGGLHAVVIPGADGVKVGSGLKAFELVGGLV